MDGISDWMVSFNKWEKLIANKTENIVLGWTDSTAVFSTVKNFKLQKYSGKAMRLKVNQQQITFVSRPGDPDDSALQMPP